eukprot:PITA_22635
MVGSRCIYKVKYAADDSVEKYKARFVAKGYAQKEGIDYKETFASVARYTSIRIVISLAAQMGWEIHQMDVKTTFLKGVIEEEKMVFTKSDANPNLYYLVVENEPLILVLYVDDLFLIGSSRLLKDCKKHLATYFDMKDLGQMHYFLGLEVWQQKVPDQTFVTLSTPLVMVESKRVHWAIAKHVLRYIQGTIEHGLFYTRGNDISLSGFTDAEWDGSSVDWKSTTGYCFNIGSRMTSWCSRKQKSVALSSAEAEYMVASTTLCEAIWLRKLLVNLFRRRMEATRITCYNQSCIKLSENPIFHDWLKLIHIRCHFVRDCVQRGAIPLRYTPIGE